MNNSLIQLTDKHYAVKVPANTTDALITSAQGENDLVSFINGIPNYICTLSVQVKILFLANTATEEDWKRLAPEVYPDSYTTASNYVHSLLQSKGIYLINPIKRPYKDDFEFHTKNVFDFEQYLNVLGAWQSFEDKVGNYLILEKL